MPASKAVKHKEGNKHRFLTFSERLSQVSVSAIHQIKRAESQDHEEDSKFYNCLQKWRDQDRSLQFQDFYSEIRYKSQNFKMVVHYKDDITRSLLQHLSIPESLALQALCELLTALCMDLRSEFYQFFNESFVILTKLLNTKEVDNMEWIFNTISLLFKYLWRCMVTDIDNVFELYKDLICGDHPVHITTFSAESITFLIRKIAHREGCFLKLFSTFKEPEAMGKVLYYVLKGVKGNLFSRAEVFLQEILCCLNDENLESDFIFASIQVAFTLLAAHIEKQHSHVIWDNVVLRMKDSTSAQISYILRLANTWCSFRSGTLILDANLFSDVVGNLCRYCRSTISNHLIDLIVSLIGVKPEYFLDSLKENLVLAVITSDKFSFETILNFWKEILTFIHRSDLAARSMLKFSQIHIRNHTKSILHLLSKYIMTKSTLPNDAKEAMEYRPFFIDYSLISRLDGISKIQESIKTILEDPDIDFSTLWMALVALQHIKPTSLSVWQTLTALLERLCHSYKSNNIGATHNLLAVVRMVIQAGVILDDRKKQSKLSSLCLKAFNLLTGTISQQLMEDQNFLFFLDLVSIASSDIVDVMKRHPQIMEILPSNLSHHDGIVRKFSLRILATLHPGESAYGICLAIEETPATIQNFRGKVLQLGKLKFSDLSTDILPSILRFIVSNLYINFSAYWPHVQEKIVSFMPDDSNHSLWSLLIDLLDAASVSKPLPIGENITQSDSSVEESFFINASKVSFTMQANVTVDFYNYRLLLWKTIAQISQVHILEKYNRRLVSLFLKYLDSEYYKIDRSYAPHQNLTDENNGKNAKSITGLICKGKKQSIKTLNVFLEVMAKFRNPSACFSATRLREIYEDLLMHGDSQIQKLSLKCFMKFKNQNLIVFEERLFALMDDGKVKETMVQFSLEEIASNERKSLIPVLFRLMYGRIVSKSGGGGQDRKRRSIIFRFLSGLSQSEMQDFLFLALKPVGNYVSACDIDQALSTDFAVGYNLREVVPLSRQHGILGTISEIVQKHPNVLSKYMLDYILKLLLSMHLSYQRMIQGLESRTNVSAQQTKLSYLRNLSKQAHVIVNSLIEVWPDTETLSAQQIHSIFVVVVNPYVDKLQHECITQPNSLLHLFDKFSRQAKFIPILGQNTVDSIIRSPIEAIMKVLVSEKTSFDVTKFVMEMLVRLLGEDVEDDDSAQITDLRGTVLRNIRSDLIDVQNVDHQTVGLNILGHFVSEIFEYFIKRLKDTKNSKGALIQSHLKLLIALGGEVTDVKLSNELAGLLISHVTGTARAGRHASPSAEEKMLLPALRSLTVIPLQLQLLPDVGKLFSRVKSRECRMLLCQIFEKAALENCDDGLRSTLGKVCSIIKDLNAWDKRFIEELDYDSRLAGFREMNDWLGNENLECLLDRNYLAFLPLVHNSIFTLENYSNDLSLREMSSNSLELSIDVVFKHAGDVDHPNIYNTVLSAVILRAIRRGLNSEDESQRHEWLRHLVKIAKLAPLTNAFSCLKILCNETDPDSDFFTNVQHIQMHRRARAFRKLTQIISHSHADFSPIMVMNYLLPLATQTLKYKDLSKHLHLRDACLEVVSACAEIMPWPLYNRLLRQNMSLIMTHPQAVKIVCSILDSFHFDTASISIEIALKLEGSFVSSKTKKKKNLTDEIIQTGFEDELDDSDVDENECNSIYSLMVCNVLPYLCNHLSGKLDSDSSHKLANPVNFSDIDQCTNRAPLAVAVVSVLRKMPLRVLNCHLPMVMLKIVTYLRHRYVEVRSAATKVIVQIAELLSPNHLLIIIKELKSGLLRGYQKHVLVHCINCIFSALEKSLEIGDVESCMTNVLNIINDDLFGKSEEEREVSKIKSKTPEARGRSKSFNIYRILAKFSKKESFLSLITPLKNILDTTHDHKKRNTAESALDEVSQGLQENSGLTAESVMIFLHGMLAEDTPKFFVPSQSERGEASRKNKSFRAVSCYLLSTEPERYGVKGTKKAQKTNMHLLIEFSLRLLNSFLKRQLIKIRNQGHMEMLDPFVDILLGFLDSAHAKTVTETVRCLSKLFKSQLPSLSKNAPNLIKSLYKVLRENSGGSVNSELATTTYKALSVLCSSWLGEKLTDTQLQVLLGYAEEMLYERDRQSHAFNAVQCILSRGLKCGEVLDVMNKIRDICIQSHDNSGMAHARQVYMYFLTHYPMTETKLSRHVEFVLTQLTFEYESGRLSALELLASVIDSIPEAYLQSNSGSIYVSLSLVLLNDESVKCKKLASHALKMLLNKIEVEGRDQLFNLLMQWYQDGEQPLHQQLAAMLVTIFVEIEGKAFSRHLSGLVPVMLEVLRKLVEKFKMHANGESENDDFDQNSDHFIFHQLSAAHSIFQNCDLITSPTCQNLISDWLQLTESLLLHPHTWVRIASCQIFGTVFSSCDPLMLVADDRPLYFKTLAVKLKILSARFCQQIQSRSLDPKLSEQCVKNLVYIVKVYNKSWGVVNARNSTSERDFAREDPTMMLLRRLLNIAKYEAANNIKETDKRSTILKFYAAVCVSLDDVEKFLPIITELIYRECERKIVEEDKVASALKALSNEVLEVVKSKAGANLFTEAYADVRKRVASSKRERKRKRDVELVADPLRAAAFKQRRQIKKKDQRKRKLAEMRAGYGLKLKKQTKPDKLH